MVLTALRGESVDRFDEPLVCSDEDVKLALKMIKVLNQHTDFAYRSLSPEKATTLILKNMPVSYKLYQSLPEEFTTNDAVEVGRSLKMSRMTVYRYMHRYVDGKNGAGCLIRKMDHGMYRKI